MSTFFNNKPVDLRHSPMRLALSVLLPLLLIVAFFGTQVINFDSIGLSSGFHHPLTGWDHLVTMLAVGIWAAQLRGKAIWLLPMAFVGVMSLGGLAGAAGLNIPSVEGIILLSCAVFSVLITRKVRFKTHINVLIVAFFAFFHGYAHGQEISTSASLISYTLGFMVATLLLHGAGILVAKLVVLAITCLLTVMFSSSALAKAVATNIDLQAGSQILVHTATDTFYADLNYPLFESQHNVNLTEQLGTGDGQGLRYSQQQHSPEHCCSQQTLANSFDDNQPTILNQWPFSAAYSAHNGLDFKHYFPDINQTPGTQLSSNGVGLTSPPHNRLSVFASLVSAQFCITPQSNLEAHLLQWLFVPALVDKTGPNYRVISRFALSATAVYSALRLLPNSALRINRRAFNLPTPSGLSSTSIKTKRGCSHAASPIPIVPTVQELS